MDPFENRYVTFTQKVLLLIGFWPTLTYKQRILRSSIPCSILLYSVLVQVCSFIILDFDFQTFVFKLQVLLPTIAVTAMYYTSILHFETVQKIFSYIKQDWQGLKNDTELKIMLNHAYQSILFIKLCTLTYVLFIGVFILLPLFRKLLFTKEVTSSADPFLITSTLNYLIDEEKFRYAILIYHIIISIVIVVAAVIGYSMYFCFLQHNCARLFIIKNEIHRPFQNNQRTVNEKPTDLSDWIIDIIQRFSRTREYMNLMNVLGESAYMVQIILVFFFIIIEFIYLFRMPILLELNANINDAVMSIVVMLSTFFIIYINCYIGQKLIDNSEDAYKEACLIPIDKTSLRTQKLLLTMLTMYRKPCVVSIGKIFVSSHEFFSNLLQTSLSFAMVLHSMKKM